MPQPPSIARASGGVRAALVAVLAAVLALTGSTLAAPSASAAEVTLDPTFTTSPSFGASLPVTVSFHGNGTTTADATMSYWFDFGDGSAPVTSSTADVQHTYTKAGYYQVRYRVTRGAQRGAEQTKVLTFNAAPSTQLSLCGLGSPYTATPSCGADSYTRGLPSQIFRVAGSDTATTEVTFIKYLHGAGYDNGLSVYVVDDDRGSVDGRVPGSPGYLVAARARAVTAIAPTTGATAGSRPSTTPVVSTVSLPTNARVAFLLLANTKDRNAVPVTLSSVAAANTSLTSPVLAALRTGTAIPDQSEHGFLQLGWEDLPDGGDVDFDDGVYLVKGQGERLRATPRLVPYAGNTAPVAAPASIATAFETAASATLTATDADEDPLTYTASTPEHGTVEVAGSTVTYTPADGFSGRDSFTYTASDGRGTSTPGTVSVTVRPEAPTVTSTVADLGSTKVDRRYSVQLTSGGGAATWSVTEGALPPGLTLSPDGLLSGPATEAGTTSFTLTVSNAGGSDDLVVPAFEVVPKDIAPRIVTEQADLDVAKVDKPYSVQLAAEGTTPQWSVSDGSLPAGLTLTPEGRLSGTPTEEGPVTFTLKAENETAADTREVTLTVAPKDIPPGLESVTLDDAVVGDAYRARLTATGRPVPTWSVTAGTLPAGLELALDGVLSGTPTAEGTSSFTATASNAAGEVSTELTVVVRTRPAITTTGLPAGTDGTAYSTTLEATGTGPITWAVSDGSLPAGFLLDPATGVLSGTPTSPSVSTFSVTATNAAGSATRELRLTVEAVAPRITTATLPQASTGNEYTAALVASGTAPVTWSLDSGTLPEGMALSSTGTLSGTPLVSGTFPVTVRASNVAGSATRRLDVVAAVPAVPAFVSSRKPLSPVVGVPYSTTVRAVGQGAISYTVVAGALPAGLSLNRSTGVVSGVAREIETADFTIAATNANGAGRQTFRLSTVRTLPCLGGLCVDLVQGAPYTGRVPDATDFVGMTVTGGTLPAGLALDPATGLVDGTPTGTGTSVLTVRVTLAGRVSFTRRISLTVHAPPVVSGVRAPAGTVGVPYTGGVSATGDDRLSYEVASGSLPSGLRLDRWTGQVTGTPRAVGSTTATVRVTSEWGSASTPVTITVARRS